MKLRQGKFSVVTNLLNVLGRDYEKKCTILANNEKADFKLESTTVVSNTE